MALCVWWRTAVEPVVSVLSLHGGSPLLPLPFHFVRLPDERRAAAMHPRVSADAVGVPFRAFASEREGEGHGVAAAAAAAAEAARGGHK